MNQKADVSAASNATAGAASSTTPPTDMPRRDRRDRGVAVYAESFGVTPEELPRAFTGRVGSLYAEEAILAAGGPAWNDPALQDRDRSVAVLTALICQGVLGDRLDTHLDRAVRYGLDEHALEVLMVLLALYAGQARTSIAAEQIQAYFRRRTAG